MKLLKLSLSLILLTALLSLSIVTTNALTLYEDGDYTYADTGEGTVALYAWNSDSDTLIVPNNYTNKYVTSVYNYAFAENSQIAAIDFSQCYLLKTIGTKSFYGCTSLSGDLVLPNTIETLSLGAFQECPNLQSFTVNGYVTVIPEQCCYKDYLLSEVNLPLNLEKIERLAFAECYSLRRIYIPDSVNFIDKSAFLNDNNVIIQCYNDSYAHQYAVENKIDHMIIDRQPGDVNGDGVVDILDATEIQKYAAESTDFTDEQFELGDINKDGYCDVIDALLVQKSVIGAYEMPQNIIRY